MSIANEWLAGPCYTVVMKKVTSAKTRTIRTPSAEIKDYIRELSPEYAAICKLLRKEISSHLPKACLKIYHRTPVWFIGENAVVGFGVTAKKGVKLLFWNGQEFDEPDLKALGKFHAAQIEFQNVSEINLKDLKRWIKKSGKKIWDFAKLRKSNQ